MEGRPKIHMHAALARGDECLMGCLREKSKVFLVQEIIIFELLGMEALREKDMRTGLSMLRVRSIFSAHLQPPNHSSAIT
jgi:predicted DNA-binding protein with PD1-like motif